MSVRGLVVSSGHELLINDGVRDFILLGVDTTDYEGKICEAFGIVGLLDGKPTIQVKTITIIADGYPEEDLVGENRGLGTLCSGRCSNGISGDAMASPGVAMPLLYSLSLHQRGHSGVWHPENDIASWPVATCRSHCTDMTKERQWT